MELKGHNKQVRVDVLLLEDNPGDAHLLQQQLRGVEGRAYAITVVERVADAVKALREGHFESVLCDLSLPDSHGLETVLKIRGVDATLPIVVLTAMDDEALGISALQCGAQDYLVKGKGSGLEIDKAIGFSVQRARLQFELQQANDNLERIVEERTVELRNAYSTLQGEQSRLSALVDSAMDAIICIDLQRRIVLFNPAAESVYGYSREEILGQPVDCLIPERFRDLEAEKFKEFSKAERKWWQVGVVSEVLGRRKCGTEFPLEAAISKAVAAEGKILVIFVRDITENKLANNRLVESEQRWRTLMEISPDAVIIHEHGLIQWVNPAAVTLLGYSDYKQFKEKPILDILMPTQHASSLERMRSIRDRGIAAPLRESLFRKADGAAVDVEIVSVPFLRFGKTAILTVARNIAERKADERRKERVRAYHAVLSGVNAMAVRINERAALFDEVCRIATRVGGIDVAWIAEVDPVTQETRAASWFGSVVPEHEEIRRLGSCAGYGVESTVCRALQSGTIQVDSGSLSVPEREVPSGLLEQGFHSAVSIPLNSGRGIECIVTFYSKTRGFFTEEETEVLVNLGADLVLALEHIRKSEKLTYLAMYDSATALPNRALFADRLNQFIGHAAGSGSRSAVALIDIDRFRMINESYGRGCGDALLVALAARLKTKCGGDHELARVGSNLFAVKFDGFSDTKEVARFFEQLSEHCFGRPFVIAGSEVHVTAKIGVAVYPSDGLSPDELLQNAEAAVKRAKVEKQAQSFYAAEMNSRVGAALVLESQLRIAVTERQFLLHYQPKVDLRSGEVTGLEALIRWSSPERGLVPPGIFIPVLEDTGLIEEVERWALGQAVADLQRFRQASGLPLRVAVNISSLHLKSSRFLQDVESSLQVGSLEMAEGLDLELTESVLMENVETSAAKLATIRALGVELAIDDFGTGYSSLAYLAQLPLNVLKIDRAFINGMTEDPRSTAIVTTIIALAGSLGMKVVAEGVETPEQYKYLKLLRCDEIQGYLVSRPVTADAVLAAFATHGANWPHPL